MKDPNGPENPQNNLDPKIEVLPWLDLSWSDNFHLLYTFVVDALGYKNKPDREQMKIAVV